MNQRPEVAPKVSLRDPDETFCASNFDDHGMYDARVRARADQGAVFEAALQSMLEADREDTGGANGVDGASMTRLWLAADTAAAPGEAA